MGGMSQMVPRLFVRARALVPLVAIAFVVAVSCGGDGDGGTPPEPDQTIRVQAFEYDFASDVAPDITAGQTVRFLVQNTGEMDHEMQVLSPDGFRLGETGTLAPGELAEVIVTFDEPGIHRLICDIDDHLTLGQVAMFDVAAG